MNRSIGTSRVLVCLSLWSAACAADVQEVAPARDAGPLAADGGSSAPDAAASSGDGDAAASPGDAGAFADAAAGLDAAVSPDGSAPPGCAACPSGTACFRDVCLDTCGAAQLGFGEADLAPDLTPLWHSCLQLRGGVVAALGSTLFHAVTDTRQRQTTITVASYPLSPNPGPAPTPACSATFEADRDGVSVTLYPQLALSPRGRWVIIGVSAIGPAPNYVRLPGRVYVMEFGTCTVESREVENYGGAALSSEDPSELLVMRSAPVALPSIYRGDVEVARAQVWLARYGADAVIASLYTGHGGHALSVISGAALESGPYPVRGGESDFDAWPVQPVVLDGGDLVGLRRGVVADGFHRWAVDATDVSYLDYSEPTLFASPVFTAVASAERRGRVALVHGGGVLVVQ